MLLSIISELERHELFPHDGRYLADEIGWLRRNRHLYVSILEDILEEFPVESHVIG